MPKYEVSIQKDNLPKGVLIDLPPVGSIANGGSVVVEMEPHVNKFLKTAHGVTTKQVGKDTEVTATVASSAVPILSDEEAEQAAPDAPAFDAATMLEEKLAREAGEAK
jgi:hypothetical protein